jgi:hypothetical protein
MEDMVVDDREEAPVRLPFYSPLDSSCPNQTLLRR